MKLSLPLVLASASPRRQQMLTQLVDSFDICVSAIEEQRQAHEAPAAYVARLAQEKAAAVAVSYPDKWVLGSDTIVVQGDAVFEKPLDQADAKRMLQALSGATHEVMTAIALVRNQQVLQQTVITRVSFRTITDDEMSAYWHSGEPQDKAGGYGIQGLAGCFVEQIEGSYSAVVGLPLCQTHQLLARAITEE